MIVHGEAPANGKPWAETLLTLILATASIPLIGSVVFSAYTLIHAAATGQLATKDWSRFDASVLGIVIVMFYVRFWLEAFSFGFLLSIYGWIRGRPPVSIGLLAAILILILDLAVLGGPGRDLPQFLLLYSVVGIIAWTLLRRVWAIRT